MLWEIDKIESKYRSLSGRCLNYQEVLSKNNYGDMINYHYKKSIHNDDTDIERIADESVYLDRIKFIKEVLGPSALDISYVGYLHALPEKNVHKKRVDEAEYIDISSNFLLSVDYDSYELFRRFILEKRIELKPYTFGRALGRCYQFDEEGSSYIRAFYDGRIKRSSVLLHEIAHAKSFDGVTDSNLSYNKRSSLYSEAIPKYYELLYANYLYNTGRVDEGLFIEGHIVNEFIAILDTFLPELVGCSDLKTVIPYYFYTYASILIALKLYYLSKIDDKLAEEYKNRLDLMMGVKSDREIFKFFDLDDKSFISDIISDYLSRYRKKKSVIMVKKD